MKRELYLCIDVGNTNITAGLFRGGRLMRKTKFVTSDKAKYAKHLKGFAMGSAGGQECSWQAAISSVVPSATPIIEACVRDRFKCQVIVLGRDLTVPIRNLYRKKGEVGQDRLVNAFAAKSIYGSPSVIIDFGTAVTFDIVSCDGSYMGGLILPGIEMSLSGLYEKTALLPKADIKIARDIIGRDTVNSIRSGILFGLGAMCDGLIAKYRCILGRGVKVIATGGNASLIQRYAPLIRIVDPDITLKGLALILQINKKSS